MKPTIRLIFRKPGAEFHSIENIFNSLLPFFELNYNIIRLYVPDRTSSLINILRNLSYIRKNKGSDLDHITGHDNYLLLGTVKPSILTLHDVSSALNGSWFRDTFFRWLWFRIPASKARFITVISDFSATELTRLVPSSKEKIRVIPNPVDPTIKPIPYPADKRKPVILHIGTKSNKNLERTIEAVSLIECRLFILGKLSVAQRQLLKSKDLDFKNYYHLSYDKVLKLYAECNVVSFASTYEGFGLPILEAQATGRPVLTSHLASMPEVAGDAAHFVDPYDVSAIRDGLMKIIQDSEYRNELIASGFENIKKFDAGIIANKYLALYREILNE